jgi:cytidine deaminase
MAQLICSCGNVIVTKRTEFGTIGSCEPCGLMHQHISIFLKKKAKWVTVEESANVAEQAVQVSP